MRSDKLREFYNTVWAALICSDIVAVGIHSDTVDIVAYTVVILKGCCDTVELG